LERPKLKFLLGPKEAPLEGAPLRKVALLHKEAERGFTHLFVHARPENWQWCVAALHSPLVLVPLSPFLSKEASQRAVDSLGVNGVWAHSLETATREDWSFLPRKALHQPWVMVQTSGSSGGPRWLVHSGAALETAARGHAGFWGPTISQGPWLVTLPWNHIGGLSLFLRAYFLNGTLALPSPGFDWLAWLASGEIRGVSLVPPQLHKLISLNVKDRFEGAEVFLVGGANLEHSLRLAALDRGWPICRTYGLTEAASQVASERMPGRGLELLPHWELRLEREEVQIRGRALALGEWNHSQVLPLPVEPEGWYRTGDLAQWGRESALNILGRASDQINTGGFKLNPREIEVLIRAGGWPEANLLVCGIPHEKWGQEVVLVMDRRPTEIQWQKVLDFLKKNTDARSLPQKLFVLAPWPRTELGKPKVGDIKEALLTLRPLFEKT
jgi:o-succinylbenzoate---CoA ligase